MSEIKPVVRFGTRRLSPEGTTEMWGDILNNAELKQGELLYTAAAYEALQKELALEKMMAVGYIARGDRLYAENEAQAKRIAELEKIKQAAENLVKCKGRYHTEQNMTALINVLAASKNGDSK